MREILLIWLLLQKHAHDKKGISESVHAYINRARVITCGVGVSSRECHNSRKYTDPPL